MSYCCLTCLSYWVSIEEMLQMIVFMSVSLCSQECWKKNLLHITASKSQAGQSDVLVTEKQFESHKTQQKPYKQLIQGLDTSEKHTYLFGKILLKKII